MPRKPKVGDIFEIPLSDGRVAYGWYLNYSQVISSKPIFPPIITGLFAAIKEKYWRVIGHQPVINFIHPNFVSTFYDEFTGKANIWFLWDGQKETRIGAVLPEDYKKFEFLVVWNPSNVVQRIETGRMPYPYQDLINNNEFTPLK